MNGKGIMSLEENGELAGLVDESTGEGEGALEFTEAAEAPIAEMTEADGDISEVVEGIETASEVAEVLEVIADKVEEIAEEGGMDEKTAEVVEVAVEALKQTIGFPKARRANYSPEAFGDVATRVQATKLSVEGFKETVKKIWEAIRNAFARLVTRIKEFFASIFTAKGRLAKRADAIKAKAAELKGKSAAADAKVNTKGFGQQISIGGTVSAGDFVKQYLSTGSSYYNKLTEQDVDDLKSVGSVITKVFTSLGKEKVDFTDISFGGDNKTPDGYKVPDGYTVLAEDLIFGGVTLYKQIPKKTSDVGFFNKIKVWVAPTKGAKEFKAEDISPLNVDQVADIAAKISSDFSTKYRSSTETYLKLIQNMEKQLVEAGKKAISDNKDLSEEAKKNIKEALSTTNYVMMAMSTVTTTYSKYDIKTAGAGLTFCAESLKLVK